MSNSQVGTPSTEYFSARSRTSSMESSRSEYQNFLQLPDEGRRFAIGSVSTNIKREFKDRKIYVNARSGLPVRPPTSFGLFKHAMRRSIKGDKVNFHEFNKRATDKWNKMTDEEKRPYSERSRVLLERYKKIEVSCLRKRVRQLQQQIKSYRRGISCIR